MGFIFCDLLFSLKYPFVRRYKFDIFVLFTGGLPILNVAYHFQIQHLQHHKGHDARKPVFREFKKVKFIPVCSATDTS